MQTNQYQTTYNTQNHEDKQTEIDKLKEKLKEKTVIAEQAQSKLEETKTQRDESQDKELENAISKISNSNKDGCLWQYQCGYFE
jgi:predicted RNase H-like nuclease (RuvC/YqgF family)